MRKIRADSRNEPHVGESSDGMAGERELFTSPREARLYLASFYFLHATVPFVFPTFLYSSADQVWPLVVLMSVYGPPFACAVLGVRYLPRRRRWLIGREWPVFSEATDKARIPRRPSTAAFYAGRAGLWITLVVILLRARDLGLA